MRSGFYRLAVVAGTGVALAACAPDPVEQARTTGNLLAAAGFEQHPANTPERVQSMLTLPPHQIVRTVHGDRVTFVYADPLVCICIFIGDQQAWGNYQRALLQLHIANQQVRAAQMNENAARNWNWGPWGRGWW